MSCDGATTRGDIEDRWPTVRAGVDHRKHPLEVAIQVDRRSPLAAELAEDRRPRSTSYDDTAAAKTAVPPAGTYDLLFSDLGNRVRLSPCPPPASMEMHVKRRAARSWRQGPIEVQTIWPWASRTRLSRRISPVCRFRIVS